MKNIYEFKSYHAYLIDILKNHKTKRGLQTRLALALEIHASYLTRVMNEEAHLTLDQAFLLAQFQNLNASERDYLILLVSKDRASKKDYRAYLENQLDDFRRRAENLTERLSAAEIHPFTENVYYSCWLHSAVHLLLTIPQLQTAGAIASKLRLDVAAVEESLHVLKKLELVHHAGGRWKPTKNNVHLDKNSWMASLQHRNWRTKVLEQLQLQPNQGVHYTGVHTMSHEDLSWFKKRLQDLFLELAQKVRPSKEETAAVTCIDLLEL